MIYLPGLVWATGFIETAFSFAAVSLDGFSPYLGMIGTSLRGPGSRLIGNRLFRIRLRDVVCYDMGLD